MNKDAEKIIKAALVDAMPGTAVKSALEGIRFGSGKLLLVAIGKAAWEMAKTATDEYKFDDGIVITKYDHAKGDLGNIKIFEAGHPVPDENNYRATEKVLELVDNLKAEDSVLFLVSGGGSALFEKPLVTEDEMADITSRLLESGADIVEVNTIRKRLSAVKGGRFAIACEPAHVYTIVLSDIIGDPLDMIASGPAYPDSSTCEDAIRIAEKYKLKISDEAKKLLERETPKKLNNVTTFVTGSVKQLCKSAEKTCREMGYETKILTSELSCEAKDAGAWLGKLAAETAAKTEGAACEKNKNKKIALIAGGETVVHVTGKGKGGRNQELALAAAPYISGLDKVCVFSFGSDGTDGPTDAAGGIVDGSSEKKLKAAGIDIENILKNNDAYTALKAIDALIITGPTGTNVNDLSVALIG